MHEKEGLKKTEREAVCKAEDGLRLEALIYHLYYLTLDRLLSCCTLSFQIYVSSAIPCL